MGKVIVAGFSLSVDGYGAGPQQSRQDPLGRGGEDLHAWLVKTQAFAQIHGKPGGAAGVDSEYAARFARDVGAFIMGRNMFGPIRGDWPDDEWKGWWGEAPPYRAPTFILTHHPRRPVEMQGGTTFHFVSDGIDVALERAKAAAGSKNVTIGGGVSTIRQYLQAGLIDEAHFAISPVLLGCGEAMFAGLDLLALGYRVTEHAATQSAMHIVLSR